MDHEPAARPVTGTESGPAAPGMPLPRRVDQPGGLGQVVVGPAPVSPGDEVPEVVPKVRVGVGLVWAVGGAGVQPVASLSHHELYEAGEVADHARMLLAHLGHLHADRTWTMIPPAVR